MTTINYVQHLADGGVATAHGCHSQAIRSLRRPPITRCWGDAPKLQTTSVKMGEIGVFWARWSAFWAHCGCGDEEGRSTGHRGDLQ